MGLISRAECFSYFQPHSVSLSSLWSSVIFLEFSLFLAKESLAEAWSILARSGLEATCNKEKNGRQRDPSGKSVWPAVSKCSITGHMCLWLFPQRAPAQLLFPLLTVLGLLLLLLGRFSCVRLCATPWTAAYQAPLSMGFSRQEHWSGVPLPSPAGLTSVPSNRCPPRTSECDLTCKESLCRCQ